MCFSVSAAHDAAKIIKLLQIIAILSFDVPGKLYGTYMSNKSNQIIRALPSPEEGQPYYISVLWANGHCSCIWKICFALHPQILILAILQESRWRNHWIETEKVLLGYRRLPSGRT